MKEYQNPIWTLIEGIRTMGGAGPLMLVAIPAALLLTGVGVGSLLRRQPLLAVIGVLHIVLTVAALLVLHMRIWPRFFFTDIAFVLLYMTQGVFVLAVVFGGWARRIGLGFATPRLLTGLAVAAMVLVSGVLMVRNYTTPKQNLVGPVTLLAGLQASPASVGTVGWVANQPYAVYFKLGWRKVETVADLEKLGAGRRYLVMIFPDRTTRDYPAIMKVIDTGYELVQRFPGTLGDGYVVVFASKPPPA